MKQQQRKVYRKIRGVLEEEEGYFKKGCVFSNNITMMYGSSYRFRLKAFTNLIKHQEPLVFSPSIKKARGESEMEGFNKAVAVVLCKIHKVAGLFSFLLIFQPS